MRALILSLLGLTAPARRATLALFAVGSALASSWLLPSIHAPGVVVLALASTALAALATSARGWPGSVAAIVLLLLHGLWGALAIAFTAVLAWSIPAWLWLLLVAAVVASATTALGRTALRVPPGLPLGLCIAAAISGWMREDGLVRCDDYLRARAAGLTVPVPSTPEMADCTPGTTLIVDRYPRNFWEAPGGARFLVSSQRGDHDYSLGRDAGRRVPIWLGGALCAVRVDDAAAPLCTGAGKADGVIEVPGRGQLYVTAHDGADTWLTVLPDDGSLRPLAQLQLPIKGAIFFLDEQRDVFGLSEDAGQRVYLRRVSDLAPLRTAPAAVIADEMRYDATRGEGVVCASGHAGNDRFPAAAFTADPFALRPLAPASRFPSSWLAATWGCDWDPVGRRVYVAVASLGALAEIDYDSGAVLRRILIGPGARPVVFDARRRRLYVGFFLEGTVLALDLDSGAELTRWPAGRFLRSMALSRDGHALLAASTLGIVRIPLDAPLPAAD